MVYEVYSFDFDGCLANLVYLASEKKNIIAANRELLNRIKLSPNPKIVFVGSNRQAIPDDFSNSTANGRGSCYPATKLISNELEATLDKFLLGDIYNDLSDGTTFCKAFKYLDKHHQYKPAHYKKVQTLHNWVHDDSKLTLLYAQIHKVVLEHPFDEIQFNFFDDREDILTGLHTYFLKYPDLIPLNVTLNLKRYMGPVDRNEALIDPQVVEYESIRGSGKQIDINYRETIKTIAAVSIEQMSAKGLDITSYSSTRPIINYFEAQQVNFDCAAINSIQYYEPGMIPKSSLPPPPVKKEKFSFFRKKSKDIIVIEEEQLITGPKVSSAKDLNLDSNLIVPDDTQILNENKFFFTKNPNALKTWSNKPIGEHKKKEVAEDKVNSIDLHSVDI